MPIIEIHKQVFNIIEVKTDSNNNNKKVYVLNKNSIDTFYVFCCFKLKNEKALLTSPLLYNPLTKEQLDETLKLIFNDQVKLPYFRMGDTFWSYNQMRKIKQFPSIGNDTLAFYKYIDLHAKYLNDFEEEIKAAYLPGPVGENSIDTDVLVVNGYHPWKSKQQLKEAQKSITVTLELSRKVKDVADKESKLLLEGRKIKH